MIQSPEQKAKELVEKFASPLDVFKININSKRAALICVEEILQSIVPKSDDERLAFELCGNQFYWQSVKTAIQNIQI